MERLAQINGYESIATFNNAKFSNLGNYINIESTTVPASIKHSEQVSPQVSKLVKKPFGELATATNVTSLSLLPQKIRDYNAKHNAPQPIITIKNKSQLAKAVVSQDNHLTYLYDKDGKFLKSFKNAVGREESPTSAGIRQITGIEEYPYNSANGTKRKAYPEVYGSKVITNVMINSQTGEKTITGELFHGTNMAGSLGRNVSGGCIRHSNGNINNLAKNVQSGEYILILPADFKKQKQAFEPTPLAIKTNDKNMTREGVQFANSLASNKPKLMKDLQIDNKTYDELARLSIGIAGQESEYGAGIRYKVKENFNWAVSAAKFVLGKEASNSRGLTQIKLRSNNRDTQVNALLAKYNINEDNLSNPDKSATATMLLLHSMSKNELPGLKNKMPEISDADALLYLWNNQRYNILSQTATPASNTYHKKVKSYASLWGFTPVKS